MKSYITKTAVALGIGLVTATSAAFGGTMMHDIGSATMTAAGDTWTFTKDATRSIVYSPVTAYHVVRGDRPLFLHHDQENNSRQSMALTGHRRDANTMAEEQKQTYHRPSKSSNVE